jgi:hypothetical protein
MVPDEPAQEALRSWRYFIVKPTNVRRPALLLLGAALACVSMAPAYAEDFPFGKELTLDAPPMRGSKRTPLLEIGDNGEVQLMLWCKNVTGQLSVAGDSIVFVPGQVKDNNCPPDRAAADDELVAALSEVTGWKRQGDALTFTGAKPLRFLMLTN